MKIVGLDKCCKIRELVILLLQTEIRLINRKNPDIWDLSLCQLASETLLCHTRKCCHHKEFLKGPISSNSSSKWRPLDH